MSNTDASGEVSDWHQRATRQIIQRLRQQGSVQVNDRRHCMGVDLSAYASGMIRRFWKQGIAAC